MLLYIYIYFFFSTFLCTPVHFSHLLTPDSDKYGISNKRPHLQYSLLVLQHPGRFQGFATSLALSAAGIALAARTHLTARHFLIEPPNGGRKSVFLNPLRTQPSFSALANLNENKCSRIHYLWFVSRLLKVCRSIFFLLAAFAHIVKSTSNETWPPSLVVALLVSSNTIKRSNSLPCRIF